MSWPAPACRHFNSRSPYGERSSDVLEPVHRVAISTHAPHTGSDIPTGWTLSTSRHFNSRSPYGERSGCAGSVGLTDWHFNSRSPYGERSPSSAATTNPGSISTHAPHTGSDNQSSSSSAVTSAFQLTLPIRGAMRVLLDELKAPRFQLTLPIRGAITSILESFAGKSISTHAPHTGSDSEDGRPIDVRAISTHAPHTGSDPVAVLMRVVAAFQLTLPIRGAIIYVDLYCNQFKISTHAPHTGSDSCWRLVFEQAGISTHAPHTGSDLRLVRHGGHRAISTHAPHTGSDQKPERIQPNDRNFNSRSPYGERSHRHDGRGHGKRFQLTLPIRGAIPKMAAQLTCAQFQLTLPIRGAMAKMKYFIQHVDTFPYRHI